MKVESTRGQLIVGRLQHFTSGGRLGFTMSLAAPALRDQWWFAAGEKGSGIDERYSLFNPTGDDVAVDVVFLGHANSDLLDPIVVPARQVVTFDPGEVTGLARRPPRDGVRHAGRAVDRGRAGAHQDRRRTAVDVGRAGRRASGRRTAFVATTWSMAVGPSVPTEDALVVYNVDNAEGTVTVEAVGAGGPVAVPGLEAVPLPPAGLLTIDLTDRRRPRPSADRALDDEDHGRAVAAGRRRARTLRQLGAAGRFDRAGSRALVELGSHGSSRCRRGDRRRRRRGRVDRAPPPVDAIHRRRAGRAAGAARPPRLRPTGRAVVGRRVHVGDVWLVRRRRQQGGGAGGGRRRRGRGGVPGTSRPPRPLRGRGGAGARASPTPTAWCGPASSAP